MTTTPIDPAVDIVGYLKQHEHKELLRFITCGSVDDGKSTLIGRLLYDSKMIFEDQLAAVKKDSARFGTTGDDFDPALLTDGLRAEREQGITIDVAYRYFTTPIRKFIIADTPGHEQYTRNMATGASTADVAVLLIDARHGIMTQTRRHSFITSLLGIRHAVVAINKMDLVDWDEAVFSRIRDDYLKFASRLPERDTTFIPMSALKGANVVNRGERMDWYDGPTLIEHLEKVPVAADRNLRDLRLPVQWVNRPNLDFRGFSGSLAAGVVRPGDEVMVLPSRKRSKVSRIVTFDGDLDRAQAPQAITLTLEDEIDVSRGDMFVRPDSQIQVGTRIEATLVWMHQDPLVAGREYLIKHTSRKTPGVFAAIRNQIDVNTLESSPAVALGLNEIGKVQLVVNEPLCFDPYARNRTTGAFIVIDRVTNITVAAGMIDGPSTGGGEHWDTSPGSATLAAQKSLVDAAARRERLRQSPATILVTGLSGSGKSDVAHALEKRLFERGNASVVLDGQSMRKGLNRDLGFSAAERSENLRRSMEVARLLNDAGLIAIGSFVAPEEATRDRARELVGGDRFLVVHLDAPIEHCRAQLPDLYGGDAKSVAVPGVDFPYEAPTDADLVLPSHELGTEACVDRIEAMLVERGVIDT
ncbi:MAG: sulfate adenylyltransferase subunit CysN [Phycisphaerales bacterium]|jgi:bifunctional enzyme CysN/CysC